MFEKLLLQSDFLSVHLTAILTNPLIYCCSPLFRFNNSRLLSC
nr:MAG TPA: hypothetical protein [Caudoviricetes sp.]